MLEVGASAGVTGSPALISESICNSRRERLIQVAVRTLFLVFVICSQTDLINKGARQKKGVGSETSVKMVTMSETLLFMSVCLTVDRIRFDF